MKANSAITATKNASAASQTGKRFRCTAAASDMMERDGGM
jgi:hypothetical protein